MLLARGNPTWWGELQGWFVMNEWAVNLIYIALSVIAVWGFFRWLDKTG